MIYINNFVISSDNTALNVSVETDSGETITSALIWTDETFKNYDNAVDVSSYLSQTSNVENFTIPASVFDEVELNGIYFIEFQTSSSYEDDCQNCSDSIGIAASLYKYKLCLFNKVKEYSVCNDFTNCGEKLIDQIININLMIDSLTTSLEFGYYGEALDILSVLKRLCKLDNNCSECGDLARPNFKTGLDYGTLDDTLILV